jgi:predicted dehydrogenase
VRAAPIGIGLVGAGAFGRRLGAAVHRSPDLELKGFTDPTEATAAIAGAELGVPCVPDLEALLADPTVDAVIIATPHATHGPLARAALRSGRHVFVEKPLTITADDARSVIATSEEAGLVLLVGHVTRLLPIVRIALERVAAGEIGVPRAAWMIRHQPLRRRGWMARRADFGGLLHSPAVHNIDLANGILGRPARVTAVATGPLQDGVEYPDLEALLITYDSGAIASLAATVSDPLFGPGGTSLVRLVGTDGGLQLDVATGSLDVRSGTGMDQVRMPIEGWGLDEALDEELRSFAGAIRGEGPPFVRPVDALHAVAVCEAADRSIASGLPIDLAPLIDGDRA